MKRFILLCLLFIAVGVSCTKDPSRDESFFRETWKAVSVYRDGSWQSVRELKDVVNFSFYEDGRYYLYSSVLGTASGTYVVDGNCLLLYASGKEYIHIEIISRNGNIVESYVTCKEKYLKLKFEKT